LSLPLFFFPPLSPSCLCLYRFYCHCPLASLRPIHICLSLLLGSRLVLVNFLVPSRPFSFISVAIHRFVSFVSKAALRTQIVLQKVRTSTLLLVLLFHVPMTAHILIFIPTLSRAPAISYMASLCTESCSCSCSYRCAGLCPALVSAAVLIFIRRLLLPCHGGFPDGWEATTLRLCTVRAIATVDGSHVTYACRHTHSHTHTHTHTHTQHRLSCQSWSLKG